MDCMFEDYSQTFVDFNTTNISKIAQKFLFINSLDVDKDELDFDQTDLGELLFP